MSTMPVETLLTDDQLYNTKFLADAGFDPPERRGTAMGLIGRLKHEPAIAEDTPDSERSPIGPYKHGLKPSERKAALERLFRTLFPIQGHDVGHKLFMAVHEELVSMGENMFDIVAAEEQASQRQKAEREADRIKREADREWNEKKDEFCDYVTAHGVGEPSEEGYALGRKLVEEGDDLATAAFEVVHRNLVLEVCYMCEANVAANTMVEVDGEKMCPDCAEEWGAKEEGCPNCDGQGRDTCPLCDGTNIPFPEEQNVSG